MKEKKFFVLLILILCLLFLPVIGGAEIHSLEQLNAEEMKIGISQGSASEKVARTELPKCTV